MLNLVSQVSVVKKISSPDGKGGLSSSTITTIIPYSALWENSERNWFAAGKYAEDSTHTLVFEYGEYEFGTTVTGCTIIETVLYNGETYETVGPCNNVMQKNEIVVQKLGRLK